MIFKLVAITLYNEYEHRKIDYVSTLLACAERGEVQVISKKKFFLVLSSNLFKETRLPLFGGLNGWTCKYN